MVVQCPRTDVSAWDETRRTVQARQTKCASWPCSNGVQFRLYGRAGMQRVGNGGLAPVGLPNLPGNPVLFKGIVSELACFEPRVAMGFWHALSCQPYRIEPPSDPSIIMYINTYTLVHAFICLSSAPCRKEFLLVRRNGKNGSSSYTVYYQILLLVKDNYHLTSRPRQQGPGL